ncbi:hypothetical protein KIPB_003784, partial [Kipferlia bialata]|eukprot:g3784.t1
MTSKFDNMFVEDLPKVEEQLQEVRNGLLSWVALSYEGRSRDTIKVIGTGRNDVDEFTHLFEEEKAVYVLFRTLAGDAESHRVKFVFILWRGDSIPMMQRAMLYHHKT